MKRTDMNKPHAALCFHDGEKLPRVLLPGIDIDPASEVGLRAMLAQAGRQLAIPVEKIAAKVQPNGHGFIASITLSGRLARPHATAQEESIEAAIKAALQQASTLKRGSHLNKRRAAAYQA